MNILKKSKGYRTVTKTIKTFEKSSNLCDYKELLVTTLPIAFYEKVSHMFCKVLNSYINTQKR